MQDEAQSWGGVEGAGSCQEKWHIQQTRALCAVANVGLTKILTSLWRQLCRLRWQQRFTALATAREMNGERLRQTGVVCRKEQADGDYGRWTEGSPGCMLGLQERVSTLAALPPGV